MSLPSIKNPTVIRNLLFVLLLLALISVGYKLYYVSLKISTFQQAEEYIKQNNMVLAEQYFTKAEENRTIDYKEERIQEALSLLDPVRRIRLLKEQAILAGDARDIPLLLDVYNNYQEQKKKYTTWDKEKKDMFNQAKKIYALENSLTTYFAQAKKQFVTQMKDNMNHRKYDEENFLPFYFAIPAEYFGGQNQKKQEIQTQLKEYDLAKFNYLSKHKKFADVIDRTSHTLNLYKEHSINSPWLLAAVDRFGRAVMEENLAGNYIIDFATNAKKYEELKSYFPSGSSTLSYIKKSVKSLLNKAKRYTAQQNFSAAIDLYKKLEIYQDTSKEIAAVERKWDEHEPIRLLQRQFPDKTFSLVANGKYQRGTKLFIAAISDENKLYYGSLLSDDTLKTMESSLEEGMRPKKLYAQENVRSESLPGIVVEGKSDVRQSLYVGFEVHESELKQIFAFEADGFYMESTGVMVVNNPIGDGAGQLAYYRPSDGVYQFSGIKPIEKHPIPEPTSPSEPSSTPNESEERNSTDPNQSNQQQEDSGSNSVPEDVYTPDPNNPQPPSFDNADSEPQDLY